MAATELLEIAGEVNGLISALERHGRLIEDSDISHPIVIARHDVHTLRCAPPNEICSYADSPPVIRIFYAWFTDSTTGDEFPVVLEMGDKSLSPTPNQWYPPIIGCNETPSSSRAPCCGGLGAGAAVA